MRPAVPNLIIALALATLCLVAPACGTQIGDGCADSLDCSPDGDRFCDRSASSPGGYCTVVGCDHDSCPDDSVCVRFFSAVFPDLTCDPQSEDVSTDDCLDDEICTIGGTCAPRLAEIRYCMQSCGGNGDCRGEYECRDEQLMIEHGGQPVLAPGDNRSSLPRFCAVAPDA